MSRPVLAEIITASEASRPITSSICCLDAVGLGGRQVDLVEDRHDLVAGVERVVDVGERLRLDALAGVDHQQRALAGGERARHLIGEVDVAGRVHQVEDVGLAVLGLVVEPHRLRLDGDAALALDIHRIEHLLDHVARRHRAGGLDQPVGERRLAVVDMGDDGEIADVVERVRRHAAGDSRGTPLCPGERPQCRGLSSTSRGSHARPRLRPRARCG